jgi:Na+/H+ antiporter NhaC
MQLPSLVENVYAVSNEVTNPLTRFGNTTTIGNLAGFAINIILGVGWALTFIMLAGGFIKYITSKGETKATDSARNWLTFAAIGGVGLFFLTVLKSVIMNLLGAGEVIPGGDSDQFDPFGGGGATPVTPLGP